MGRDRTRKVCLGQYRGERRWRQGHKFEERPRIQRAESQERRSGEGAGLDRGDEGDLGKSDFSGGE